jgi:hypothetical protein
MAAVDGMALLPGRSFFEFFKDIYEMFQQQGLSNDGVVAALKRRRFKTSKAMPMPRNHSFQAAPPQSGVPLESFGEVFVTAGPVVSPRGWQLNLLQT